MDKREYRTRIHEKVESIMNTSIINLNFIISITYLILK